MAAVGIAMAAGAAALLPPLASPRVAHAGTTATDEAPSMLVDAAHDSRQPSDPLTPGLAEKWVQHFDALVSYPVVSGGRAFFTVAHPAAGSTAAGTRLYAVDAASGATDWGPVSIPFTMPNSAWVTFSDLAFDGGRVYLMGGDMVLRAYDAATGSPLWTATLGDPTAAHGDYQPAIPEATGGLVYVVTASSDSATLHAIDGSTGAVAWTAPRTNQSSAAVAVVGGVVYDVQPGSPGYAYDAATGAPVWTSPSGATRAGGTLTTQVYNGHIFAREAGFGDLGITGEIYNTSDDSAVHSYYADQASTFDGATMFSVWSRTLEARNIASGALLWSFAGDNLLNSDPIVANGHVYEADQDGTLYALDEATGQVVWEGSTGMQFPMPGDATSGEGPTQTPAVAEGLLFLPGGNDLAAWGSGGPAAAPVHSVSPRTANQADEATALQVDRGHDGAQSGDALQAPLVRAWSTDLPGDLSYPVIADGRLFVIAMPTSGTVTGTLYAFNASTGAQLWTEHYPKTAIDALAYDRGRLIVWNGQIIRALDPADGNTVWSRAVMPGWAMVGAPTVDASGRIIGIRYSSGGPEVFETDTGGELATGYGLDASTATLSATTIYTDHDCQDVDAISLSSLAQVWRDQGTCSSAGAPVPVLHGGRLYVRDTVTPDGPVLDASSGSRVGTLLSDGPEAVDDTTAFAVHNGALEAHNVSDQSLRWSFSGDSAFDSAPLVANGVVYAGTSKGTMYGLSEASGAVVFQDSTGGGAFQSSAIRGLMQGNALAEGLLAITPGQRLVVYRSASAATPTPAPTPTPTPSPQPPPGPSCRPTDTYRMVGSDGGIFDFNGAEYEGGMGGTRLNAPVVGMAATPDGRGYWLVASDGGVFAFGDAGFYQSMGGTHLNAPIVGMAATPSGRGYWLVASDGGVFSFGDAGFYQSMGGTHLNAPIAGMAATPSGRGYWLVAADGGVFSFGDAGFYQSMGGTHLNAPIVGMARTPSGRGYWLVARDGGIFSFGDAPFLQSMGGTRLNAPVLGMAATGDGRGYWLVASDGGIFSFGDAPFAGSMGGTRLNAPVRGIAAGRECV